MVERKPDELVTVFKIDELWSKSYQETFGRDHIYDYVTQLADARLRQHAAELDMILQSALPWWAKLYIPFLRRYLVKLAQWKYGIEIITQQSTGQTTVLRVIESNGIRLSVVYGKTTPMYGIDFASGKDKTVYNSHVA